MRYRDTIVDALIVGLLVGVLLKLGALDEQAEAASINAARAVDAARTAAASCER